MIPMWPYSSFSRGKFLTGSMFATDNFSPFETTSISSGTVADSALVLLSSLPGGTDGAGFTSQGTVMPLANRAL